MPTKVGISKLLFFYNLGYIHCCTCSDTANKDFDIWNKDFGIWNNGFVFPSNGCTAPCNRLLLCQLASARRSRRTTSQPEEHWQLNREQYEKGFSLIGFECNHLRRKGGVRASPMWGIFRALLSLACVWGKDAIKNPALRRGDVYLVPGIEWYLAVIR